MPRLWIGLLVAAAIAVLVYVITGRLLGVTLLVLPLFFVWGGGRDR